MIKYQDVPNKTKGRIFRLSILLQWKHDQQQKITRHKAGLIMMDHMQNTGVDVCDTYTRSSQFTIRQLIHLGFVSKWEMFHCDICIDNYTIA